VRLTQAEQGAVGGTWPGSPSMTAEHTWTWDSAGDPRLDDLGNWLNFNNDGTADARTHNTANEIEFRWYGGQARVITYDEAGNVATLQVNDATDGWRYTYDYRNRLIKIESTEDITENPIDWEEAPIALYSYDGLNRRIKKEAHPAEAYFSPRKGT